MKRTTIKPIALLACGLVFTPSVLGDCKCRRTEAGETTRWGGNEVIVAIEEKSYRQLRGLIQMQDDRPLEDALVEIFDKPDYLLDPNSSRDNHPQQKRLAACRTAADGKFCFRKLPSGTYELRSSISSGWNVTQVHIILDKKAGQDKNVIVTMRVGT